MSKLTRQITDLKDTNWCAQTFVMNNYHFRSHVKYALAISIISLLSLWIFNYIVAGIQFIFAIAFACKAINLYVKEISSKNSKINQLFKTVLSSNEAEDYIENATKHSNIVFSDIEDKKKHQEKIIFLMQNDINTIKLELKEKRTISKNYISRTAFIERLIKISEYQTKLQNYAPA